MMLAMTFWYCQINSNPTVEPSLLACGFGTTDDCFNDMNLCTGFGNFGYSIEIKMFKAKNAINALYRSC